MPDQPQPNQDEPTPQPQSDETGYYSDPAIRPDDPAGQPVVPNKSDKIPPLYIVVAVPFGIVGLLLAGSGLWFVGLLILVVLAFFIFTGYKSRQEPSQVIWKAIGGVLGALIAASGLLVVGFFVFVVIAFASWGSSSGK